jgi:hypothetical protein
MGWSVGTGLDAIASSREEEAFRRYSRIELSWFWFTKGETITIQ